MALRRRGFVRALAGGLASAALLRLPAGAAALGPLPVEAAALDRLVFVNDMFASAVAVVDSRDDRLLGRIALGHVADVMAIARGRGLLVTASWEEPALRLTDLAKGLEPAHIPLGHSLEHFQLSPDERLVAAVDYEGGGLSLVDLARPHEVRRIEGLAAPHNVVFAPEGWRLYATNLEGERVSVIDPGKGRIVEEIPMPFAGVTDLALSADGRQALVLFSGRDEAVMLDLAAGRSEALLTLGEVPFHAYPTQAGRRLIVPNNGDGTVSIVSFDARRETARLEAAGGMTAAVAAWFDSVAFLPSTDEQGVLVLDLDRERLLEPIPLPGRPGEPALGPLGRKLYVPLMDRGALAVIDAAERRLSGVIEGVSADPWIARMAGSLNYCH